MSGLNPGVYAKNIAHCTLYETPVCLSDCVYEKSPRVLARFSQSYEHSFKVIWSLITYQNVGEKCELYHLRDIFSETFNLDNLDNLHFFKCHY